MTATTTQPQKKSKKILGLPWWGLALIGTGALVALIAVFMMMRSKQA